MGEVISRKAARDRIIEDVKTTVTEASARASGPEGETWAAAATRLGPMVTLYGATSAKATAAQEAVAPFNAAVSTANEASDRLIKTQLDYIWNELGRPANDPIYELLAPGGAGFYTDSPDDEQPDLMELLADLLESNIHPKLSQTVGPKVAAIRDSAQKFAAAVDAARKPRARAKLYDRMLTAVARAAHIELAKLKRFWLSAGLSEAQVHAVIPDRPRSYGVAPATPPVTPSEPTA